jgi:hypothetical protein
MAWYLIKYRDFIFLPSQLPFKYLPIHYSSVTIQVYDVNYLRCSSDSKLNHKRLSYYCLVREICSYHTGPHEFLLLQAVTLRSLVDVHCRLERTYYTFKVPINVSKTTYVVTSKKRMNFIFRAVRLQYHVKMCDAM